MRKPLFTHGSETKPLTFQVLGNLLGPGLQQDDICNEPLFSPCPILLPLGPVPKNESIHTGKAIISSVLFR